MQLNKYAFAKTEGAENSLIHSIIFQIRNFFLSKPRRAFVKTLFFGDTTDSNGGKDERIELFTIHSQIKDFN